MGGLEYETNSDALDFSKAKGRALQVPKDIRQKINMKARTTYGDAHVRKGHSFSKMLDKVLSDVEEQKGINSVINSFKKGGNILNVNKLDSATRYFDVTGEGADSSESGQYTFKELFAMKEDGDGFSRRAKNILRAIPNRKPTSKAKFTHYKDAVDLDNLYEEEENLSKGFVPSFASAKDNKAPLYDLDGTIIKEGFFDWNDPAKVSQIKVEDLTELGKCKSKELQILLRLETLAPFNSRLFNNVGINMGNALG